MATDLARLSFDEARHYTGVVPQQGRVSLESEQNEQRVIDAEERRKELLDIVGNAGTPDNGYEVSFDQGVTVGPGTMYLGGMRLELDEAVQYANQSEWLDRPDVEVTQQGNGHVMLVVEEVDVTAVEDPMLFEPALGGPDGAARIRFVQRVELIDTPGSTCSEALLDDQEQWQQSGLDFDPATMRLESNSRLLVTWDGVPPQDNPCEPTSVGGYLGAENQLIRVQITSVNEDGTFDIVWGYDDASMLYRVTTTGDTNPVLTLQRSPVDDFHRPRSGQAVQLLRSTAALESTDGVVEGYVASLGGLVGVLTAPYDPDTKTVSFPVSPLPPPYVDPDQTPQLYLRVWEEMLTGNRPGTAVSLTGTGLSVTITTDGDGALHVDDFWCIAVRPSTPTTVYPDRLLRTPQPPDGPRLWACPLALIAFQNDSLVVVEDCRNHFPPLIDMDGDGCCTLEVRPSDTPRLQVLIDAAVARRAPNDRVGRVTVCFMTGRYVLREPLVLRRQHSNITLKACSFGSIVSAATDEKTQGSNAFRQGLIVLADADNVTISGFEFELPQVLVEDSRVSGTSGGVFARDVVRAINTETTHHYVSIGIRAVDAAVLEVTDCVFRFQVGEQSVPEQNPDMPRSVFGVGVFAAGGAWGLSLYRNRFHHHPTVPIDDSGVRHLLVGYLLTPTATPRVITTKESRALGGARLPALLTDAEIADNGFVGITVPVFAVATLGAVRLADNLIMECYGGIWLIDATSLARTDLIGKYEVTKPSAYLSNAQAGLSSVLLDPVLLAILLLSETYPLPSLEDLSPRDLKQFDLKRIAAERKLAAEAESSYMTDVIGRLQDEAPIEPAGEVPRKSAKAAPAGPAPSAEAPAPGNLEFNPKLAVVDESVALTTNAMKAWGGLRELQGIDVVPTPIDGVLRIANNDISCTEPGGSRSGPALFIYSLLRSESPSSTSAVIGENRLASSPSSVTAAIFGLGAATITGNIITGEEKQTALAALLVTDLAVTGNVVRGGALLPASRPFPAPLDSWLPLNTIRG